MKHRYVLHLSFCIWHHLSYPEPGVAHIRDGDQTVECGDTGGGRDTQAVMVSRALIRYLAWTAGPPRRVPDNG